MRESSQSGLKTHSRNRSFFVWVKRPFVYSLITPLHDLFSDTRTYGGGYHNSHLRMWAAGVLVFTPTIEFTRWKKPQSNIGYFILVGEVQYTPDEKGINILRTVILKLIIKNLINKVMSDIRLTTLYTYYIFHYNHISFIHKEDGVGGWMIPIIFFLCILYFELFPVLYSI